MARVPRLVSAALVLGIIAAVGVRSAPLASAQVSEGSKYTHLRIAPIEVKPNIVFPAEYRGALLDHLVAELRKAQVFAEVAEVVPRSVQVVLPDGRTLPLPSRATSAPAGAEPLLVLTVSVVSFEPGNRAQRQQWGFGAGAAKLEVSASFVDARTCVTVLEQAVSNTMRFGWAGGDSINVTKGVAEKMGELAKRMDRRIRASEPADCPVLSGGAPDLVLPAGSPTANKFSPSAGPELSVKAKVDALQATDIPGLAEKAAAGDAEAQSVLGRAYVNGRHVPKDVKKGLALYEQSALQGFRPAQSFLADEYYVGTNIPQNYAEAFKWWSAAAEQGSPEAQLNLAAMYIAGEGRRKDPKAAVDWMLKAAALDLPKAQLTLGQAYASGYGVAKDDTEAVKWLQRAAEGGDSAAMVLLGLRHEDGHGVTRDPEQSVRYYRQAAELGDADGMCYLADMYRAGVGIGQSNREAYRWAFLAHNARCTAEADCTFCETTGKAAREPLTKAEREAAERDAKEWAAAFNRRLAAATFR